VSGRSRQYCSTSADDMTMNAVDRASAAAADGHAAQAAVLPCAGLPVLGSIMCGPLMAMPEPLNARLHKQLFSGGLLATPPTPTDHPRSPSGRPRARTVLSPALTNAASILQAQIHLHALHLYAHTVFARVQLEQVHPDARTRLGECFFARRIAAGSGPLP